MNKNGDTNIKKVLELIFELQIDLNNRLKSIKHSMGDKATLSLKDDKSNFVCDILYSNTNKAIKGIVVCDVDKDFIDNTKPFTLHLKENNGNLEVAGINIAKNISMIDNGRGFFFYKIEPLKLKENPNYETDKRLFNVLGDKDGLAKLEKDQQKTFEETIKDMKLSSNEFDKLCKLVQFSIKKIEEIKMDEIEAVKKMPLIRGLILSLIQC